MAHDLIEDERSTTRLHPEPAPERQASLARVQALPWLLVIALLALAAWLGWRAFFHQADGDIVGSAMLTFEKQNALTVFSSRFEVVAESVNTPNLGPLPIDPLKSRQAMIVPATVEYRLDLADMDRGDFAWDEAAQTLTVILPPMAISTPNLDEAKARYFTEGVYVSRTASTSLSRNNSEIAERQARKFAENPEIVAMARRAAKDAVRQNLAVPLQVAGYGDVRVNVRFVDEASTAS